MKNISSFKKVAFVFYVLVYMYFIFRYFILDYALGYGIGDIVYVGFFSLWMILSTAFYIKIKEEYMKFSVFISSLNIVIGVYVLLMMFVYSGAEIRINKNKKFTSNYISRTTNIILQ